MKRTKLWLCLPVVVMTLMDHGFTLWGQGEAYWAGDYAAVQELHEVSAALLRWRCAHRR